MRGALVLLAASAALAHADPLPTIDDVVPPQIRITGPVKDVTVERGDVTWLSFAVPADDEGAIEVTVPRATLVIGMGLAPVHGKDMPGPLWGAPVAPRGAYERVHEATGALLEWDSGSADAEHLSLRRVKRDCTGNGGAGWFQIFCPETVTLALVLPRLARVEISPRPTVVDGKRAHGSVIALPAPHELQAEPPHADAETSLAVLEPPVIRFEDPSASTGWTARTERSLDKAIIRRQLERRMNSLRWCIASVAQYRGLEGTATLHFTIEPAGTVDRIAIESGFPDEINACLAKEVAALEYPETDGAVQVNYPLTFRITE